FDQQIIERKPDRPTPIRIPAEQLGIRFARRIMHFELAAFSVENVGMLLVNLRKRSNPKRREKLVLVQRIFQNALQALELWDSEKQALSRLPVARDGAGGNVARQVFFVLQKPVHSFAESR